MVSIKAMLPRRLSRKSSPSPSPSTSGSSSPTANSPKPKTADSKLKASETQQLPPSSSSSSPPNHHKITVRNPVPSSEIIELHEEVRGSGSRSSGSGSEWGGMEEEVRAAFGRFDVNGDGKVSAEEVREVMRIVLGGDMVTEEEAKLMVADVDGDGDGLIDFEDFIRLFFFSDVEAAGASPASCPPSTNPKDKGHVRDAELAAAFDIFDLDRNGSISAEELHTIMCRLFGDGASSIQDCQRIICRVDTTGAGHVVLKDFMAMMTTTTTESSEFIIHS